MDLAGNGLNVDETAEEENLRISEPFVYGRFEPMGSPVLALTEPLPNDVAGESAEDLVIRSGEGIESSAGVSERVILPPKISQTVAEKHGLFDEDGAPSTSAYGELARRDEDPLEPVIEDPDDLPYFPDPMAWHFEIQNAPGPTPWQKLGVLHENGWPESRVWRLRLREPESIEHGESIEVDSDSGIVTVYLPKGDVHTLQLTCGLKDEAPGDVEDALSSFGVYQWAVRALTQTPVSEIRDWLLSHGRHLISTSTRLTLTHAVRRPLFSPEVVRLRDSRAASEAKGTTAAALTGKLHVPGRTAHRLEAIATWQDRTDEGLSPVRTANAFELLLPSADTEIEVAEEHDFGDTRTRQVTYRLVATTRFRSYFPASDDPEEFRIGDGEFKVRIKSSSPPPAPKVAYVVPLFSWDRNESGRSIRHGNTVRVYLERPWFVSGDSEMLGVLIQESEYSDAFVTRLAVDPVFHVDDPTPTSGPISFDPPTEFVPPLDPADFPNSAHTEAGVQVGAFTQQVTTTLPFEPQSREWTVTKDLFVKVLAHDVDFDESRRLWYADIAISPGRSYRPFLRLALVRYQPHGIEGARVSPPVVTPFVQLSAKRDVTVERDGIFAVQVTVRGEAPPIGNDDGTASTLMEAHLERQRPGIHSELAWDSDDALPERLQRSEAPIATWTGRLELQPGTSDRPYRVCIREYEVFGPEPDQRRLAFAENILL